MLSIAPPHLTFFYITWENKNGKFEAFSRHSATHFVNQTSNEHI